MPVLIIDLILNSNQKGMFTSYFVVPDVLPLKMLMLSRKMGKPVLTRVRKLFSRPGLDTLLISSLV